MQLLNLPPLLLQKAAAVILDTNYKTILVEIFTQNSLYIEETGSAPVYVKYGLTQRPKGRVISKWTQSAVSWWNWPEIEHTYNPFAFVSVIFCFIHCVWMTGSSREERWWRQRSDIRDSFWIFERLVPLWVVCTRHTRRTCDGDLFVLSLCTVLKSSFSFLLFLMPLRESECDRKGLFFFYYFILYCLT